jgi:hypothetical protein
MSHLFMLTGRNCNPLHKHLVRTYVGTDMCLGKCLTISCLHHAIRGLLWIVYLHRTKE